jgi:hypothetical protein
LTKAVDTLSVLLLLAAAGAFTLGIDALGDAKDLHALYWLVAAGLLLRSGVDLLRPRSGAR